MSRIPDNILEQYPDAIHARWGQGSNWLLSSLHRIAAPTGFVSHPSYDFNYFNWQKWRSVFEAGDPFVDLYTKQFSNREDPYNFNRRKSMTPVPAFASAAIIEIKNSIFERLIDVTRKGGTPSYQLAIQGKSNGVDLKKATINWFIGHNLISELLVMKKVGVYVDSPNYGTTLADVQDKHPYLYTYKAEDILNWAYAPGGNAQDFSAVRLRDWYLITDPETGLPIREQEVFRLIYVHADGRVHVRLTDAQKKQIADEQILDIPRIPLVVFEITESLMKFVANHQIALLNMESSDVSYSLQGMFPFLVEQYNPAANTPYLKQAQDAYNQQYCDTGVGIDPTSGLPFNPDAINPIDLNNPNAFPFRPRLSTPAAADAEVGATQGRRYPIGADAPSFINPSAEPLTASMAKQQALKDDVRKLVHLALSTVQSKAMSADSKAIDQQGLEAGLSYIGLELEHGERKIADHWAMYERSSQTATINYPERWSLKTSDEIQKEVEQLKELRDDLPSATFKKEMNKRIAQISLGAKITPETLTTITKELDEAKGATSDPATISVDLQNGLVSQQTASNLRSYPDDEVGAAKQDQADRLALIAAAQSPKQSNQGGGGGGGLDNPAARGLADLATNPASQAAAEKVGQPGRGPSQG